MPSLNKLTTLLGTAAMAAAIAVVGAPKDANAALVTITVKYNGNDCTGALGTSPNCAVNGSPQIAKYDLGDEDPPKDPEWSFNPIFTVDETNFAGSDFLSSDDGTGTWTYTPGAGDPGIRYWSVKGGNFFNLQWIVDDAIAGVSAACANNSDGNPDQVCLDAAIVVETGTYETPINPNNPNNQRFGLSHIVFYDTDSDGPNGQEIPEPGSIALLGLGLLGLGYAARRRKRAA